MLPSGRRIWKKPSPSIIRSRGFDVCEITPWVKTLLVATSLTPCPISTRVGADSPEPRPVGTMDS